jgi:glutathione synthase
MDPMGSIKPHKDSTLAMLLEAQARGWELEYMELGDLRLRGATAEATARPLQVRDDPRDWYELGAGRDVPLGDVDVILMRKDPPVDFEYVAATWILERAEAQGALVSNRPRALRDANEKLAATWFPECTPASLVTRSRDALRAFLEEHGVMVLKRLDTMGGRSIFVVRAGDPNTNVILEEMTLLDRRYVVAQAFIPDVTETGDTRILLVDGEPVPHALRRLPAPGDFRANIAAGATAEPCELTERELWICGRVGPELAARGLAFVGLDVVGGHLTEVNVTSPTCIREIDRFFGVNVAGVYLDALEARLG